MRVTELDLSPAALACLEGAGNSRSPTLLGLLDVAVLAVGV